MAGFEWLKDRWMQDRLLDKVKALGNLAKELGTTLPALSIAWCIKNPNVTTAILGATKKEQLLENLKALDVTEKLTPEIMQRIDDIAGTKPVLPEY
jgi:aryl-alcohol dehydrogenase-like predicted oxidoreductase